LSKDELKEQFEKFDNDENLKSIRKFLVTVSMILIALELSGATIKEANTFLFKLEFRNESGVTYLLVFSILYLIVRYYNYAQPYHQRLFELWSSRMLKDPDFFYYNNVDDGVYGFISAAIDVYGGDEPGVSAVTYEVSGLFKRRLSYPTAGYSQDGDQEYFPTYINLNKWTDKWKFRSFLKLLAFEAKYQGEAFLKHREHLDILAPYFVALIALSCVVLL